MPKQFALLFSEQFIERLRHWIGTHHTIYPQLPPHGIYFESLVERAFLHAGWPRDQVVLEHPNSPKADIRVGRMRLSLSRPKPDEVPAGIVLASRSSARPRPASGYRTLSL